jgi:hypothetical protein
MFNVCDTAANRWTGAICEIVAAARDSGLFKGQVKVRYQSSGQVYYIAPEFLTDARYSSEIKRANKQKRSPCLEERVPLDPIQDFHNPVFAKAGADDIEDKNV